MDRREGCGAKRKKNSLRYKFRANIDSLPMEKNCQSFPMSSIRVGCDILFGVTFSTVHHPNPRPHLLVLTMFFLQRSHFVVHR